MCTSKFHWSSQNCETDDLNKHTSLQDDSKVKRSPALESGTPGLTATGPPSSVMLPKVSCLNWGPPLLPYPSIHPFTQKTNRYSMPTKFKEFPYFSFNHDNNPLDQLFQI